MLQDSLSRQLIILFILIRFVYACSEFPTCESCTEAVYQKKCRWCSTSLECIHSKYMCHPRDAITSSVNCPVLISSVPSYSDQISRNEMIYYILAANRIANSDEPQAIQSCLDKVGPSVKLESQIIVKTFRNSQIVGCLMSVDHARRRIVISFRATVGFFQFVTQGIHFLLNMYEDSPLGGKMIRYYAEAYQDILDGGFDEAFQKTINGNPTYDVMTCGHSMGGSLANIFSLHIKQTFAKTVYEYSMSGPRVGDENFVKQHHRQVDVSFRIIRDGDWIPDFPFRISEKLIIPYHTKYEVFYNYHMTNDSYRICSQPDSDACNRGSWWRKLTSHMFMFDHSMLTFGLGLCNE